LIIVLGCGNIHNHIFIGAGSKDDGLDYASFKDFKLTFM